MIKRIKTQEVASKARKSRKKGRDCVDWQNRQETKNKEKNKDEKEIGR